MREQTQRSLDARRARERVTAANAEQSHVNAELNLRVTRKGFELERALLALRERRAVEDARRAGESLELVRREFDLRRRLLNQRKAASDGLDASIDVFGGFDAEAVSRQFATMKLDPAGEGEQRRTADASVQTARNTEQIARVLRGRGATFA